MDPFTITVGALGITHFALSSISQLHKTISSLPEAQDLVQDLISNLEAIHRPLTALQDFTFPDSPSCTAAKENLKKTGLAEAVNKCGQACSEFDAKLNKWTKHSTDARFSLRDRLSIGVWNREKINTFKTRVHTCQSIVQFSVESTQLLVQLHATSTTDTHRSELNTRLQALETSIQHHVSLTKTLHEEAQQSMQQLRLSTEAEAEEDDDDDDDDAATAQRNLAMQEVEERSRLLEADESFANAVSERLHAEFEGRGKGDRYEYSGTISGRNYKGIQIVNNPGTINWTAS